MKGALYRVSARQYLPQDPTGAAGTSEGRWHLMGQRVLYFSSSLALCVLELRANAVSFRRMREAYHYCALAVDDVELSHDSELAAEALYSRDWILDKQPTQQYGSDWYGRRNSLVLTVKSAVLPTERNYIVNAAHPRFDSLIFSAPLAIPLARISHRLPSRNGPRRRGDKERDRDRRRRTRQYVEAADRAQRSIREHLGRCSRQSMRNAG